MPELADMRVQAEAHPVADPATDDKPAIIGCMFPFHVLPSVADTGVGAGGDRHAPPRGDPVPAMAADTLRHGADTDARPGD